MNKIYNVPSIQVQVKQPGEKSMNLTMVPKNFTLQEVYDTIVDALRARWREKNG